MPQPRRPLPLPPRASRDRAIPWRELRRSATTLFLWLQAGWLELDDAERAEATRLLRKSRGRPRNLTKEEARTLGRLAGRAAAAARRSAPPPAR